MSEKGMMFKVAKDTMATLCYWRDRALVAERDVMTHKEIIEKVAKALFAQHIDMSETDSEILAKVAIKAATEPSLLQSALESNDKLRNALEAMDQWITAHGGPSFDLMPCVQKMREALGKNIFVDKHHEV